MCGRGHLVLRMPCPGSSPRRLTLRIGWARKALSTSYLQIPLPELGDFPARRSLLGRLTRRRRKPAVGNTVLRPGHAKLLWAVDPGQTRVQARRSRQSRGNRRALALQAHKPPRRQRSKAGARLSCCQSALVRVYPLPLVFIEFFPGVRFFEVSLLQLCESGSQTIGEA